MREQRGEKSWSGQSEKGKRKHKNNNKKVPKWSQQARRTEPITHTTAFQLKSGSESDESTIEQEEEQKSSTLLRFRQDGVRSGAEDGQDREGQQKFSPRSRLPRRNIERSARRPGNWWTHLREESPTERYLVFPNRTLRLLRRDRNVSPVSVSLCSTRSRGIGTWKLKHLGRR